MRLLQLRFTNINSLAGTWEIDFTNADFRRSPLFAIIGPTGSGKSTILDAVSLALYATTPRMTDTHVKFEGPDACPVMTKGKARPAPPFDSRRTAASTCRDGAGARSVRAGFPKTKSSLWPSQAPKTGQDASSPVRSACGKARSSASRACPSRSSPARCCLRRAPSPTSSRLPTTSVQISSKRSRGRIFIRPSA